MSTDDARSAPGDSSPQWESVPLCHPRQDSSPRRLTCRLWRYSEAGALALVFSGGAANLGWHGVRRQRQTVVVKRFILSSSLNSLPGITGATPAWTLQADSHAVPAQQPPHIAPLGACDAL